MLWKMRNWDGHVLHQSKVVYNMMTMVTDSVLLGKSAYSKLPIDPLA